MLWKKERKHSALRSKKSEVDMHVNSFRFCAWLESRLVQGEK